MVELSPLDILGKSFNKSFKGFAIEEVQEFLQLAANAMETALRERGEYRQQVHRLEQELAAFRARENALQDALVSAQRSAEQTLDAARGEGQRIINEGQELADRVLDEAHERAKNIETVISDLRSRRREVRSEVMRLVELLQGFVVDDQQLEKEERSRPRLVVMPRRHGSAEAM